MPRLLKNGVESEESIQRSLIQWIRQYPDISPYVMHFPNEGKRSLRYGALMKALGMRKGVSDIFIALPRQGYHGAWIELKSIKGYVSPHQEAFLADMSKEGYFTTINYSFDDARMTMEWYIFSKGAKP